MRIILLLAVVIRHMSSDKAGSKNLLRASLPRHSFFATPYTPVEELLRSDRKQIKIDQTLKKGTDAKSRVYNSKIDGSILKVNFERGIGRAPLESDIVLTAIQAEHVCKDVQHGTRTRRQVLKDHRYPTTIWQGGVFYKFNTSDPAVQKVFKIGAKVWNDATCIDFVENRDAKDKLVVISEVESWSDVGRVGGDQLLSIGESYITVWSAMHEIGHALGLFHTMARYDRDKYIRIAWNNVDPVYINEFGIVNKSYVDVYGLTYDYGSIMHYNELSGSANYQPTVIAIDAYYQKTMGSEVISFSDIFMINEHYGCNAKCNLPTAAKCLNGGYPHPRNCSICICPGGYGGALCDQRPNGCGEDLVAKTKKQTLAYRQGFGSDLRDVFDFCNYMIMAPEGKKIEVDVRSITHGYDVPGCTRGGVEVKAQKDQKLTGYRFCSMNGSNGPIVSSSNRLPVIMFNRLGKMQATFTYRFRE